MNTVIWEFLNSNRIKTWAKNAHPYQPSHKILGYNVLPYGQKEEKAMATSLSIDTNLLNEALLISGLSTKKDTVNQALLEFVQRRKQREITTFFGQLPPDDQYNYKKGREWVGYWLIPVSGL